ncbi:hypothetical protein C8P68_102812 [Mucilaginibacter yixingensis]|uniref:3-oxoacyl-ACP synthase n=1 Tax=Mucilaginibacter yixingensis TaxID=1295612 RepID=A0A2T5JDY5_9SPHI|nr:3-oxoacyl-ACP synthase [Mucilaginibacter yixingensis]PTQ99981.1 hypothetical protein C8P68_102812 [Mucilaginibacter yixingensis]
MSNLKTNLHRLCLDIVEQRMETGRQALKSAEDGAEQETKSSAGDKYETAREMMQQEKNRAMAQLNEANKLLVALQGISTNGEAEKVQAGSVISTDKGNFYLSISAGVIKFEGKDYFAVSPASPIGTKLMGKQKGDSFDMNGKHYQIINVI